MILALNIPKAALDSGKKRMIYWNAESNKLRSEGIPISLNLKVVHVLLLTLSLKMLEVRSYKIIQKHYRVDVIT